MHIRLGIPTTQLDQDHDLFHDLKRKKNITIVFQANSGLINRLAPHRKAADVYNHASVNQATPMLSSCHMKRTLTYPNPQKGLCSICLCLPLAFIRLRRLGFAKVGMKSIKVSSAYHFH